jgi:hypothetical protein
MPVSTPHPEYSRDIRMWTLLRDCYEGEEAVNLPKLAEDSPDEYDAYRMRASFFPALTRTVDGLVGGVFRVEPIVEFPEQDWADDVTLTGMNIPQLSKLLTTECAIQARVGVLVDWDDVHQRPFLTVYPTETILNWGRDYVVLREKIYEPGMSGDIFATRTVIRYRFIQKLPEGGAKVETYEQVSIPNKAEEGVSPTPSSTRFIRPVMPDPDFFPFVFIRPLGDAITYARPPLLGLARVNLSCYLNSADLENGRHLTALPTPWIADDDIKNEIKSNPGMKIKLGSKAAFILGRGSQAGFLEYTGQGLGALERAIEQKKSEMAALGAMMILQQRKQVESSETARIHASAQTSIMGNIVTGTENGVRKALDLMLRLANRKAAFKFTMNRDFVEVAMDPTELLALVQTWQAGGFDQEILAWNLKKAGYVPPETSIEDVIKKAQAEVANRQKKAMEVARATGGGQNPLMGQAGDPTKAERRQTDKGAKSDPPRPNVEV